MLENFKSAVRTTVGVACLVVAAVMIGTIFDINVYPLGGKYETEQTYQPGTDVGQIKTQHLTPPRVRIRL